MTMFRRRALAIIILGLALVAAIAVYFVAQPAVRKARAAEFLPADTLVLLQVPDFSKSRERWRDTALYKIWQEPEVQTFLQQPRARFEKKGRAGRWQKLLETQPREIFVALTHLSDSAAKGVAGIQFDGDRKQVEALWQEAKERLQERHPAGRWDLIKHEGDVLETFSHDDQTWGAAFNDKWFFAANDVELLQSLLARFGGSNKATVLANDERFRSAVKHLPGRYEGLAYVQPKGFPERLAMLAQFSGRGDLRGLNELKQIEAMAASVTFQGAQIRDTIFLLNPKVQQQQPLEHHALALTSPETLLYQSALLEFPPSLEFPETPDATGIFQMLRSIQEAVESQGLAAEDLPKAFGPEMGALVDWPPTTSYPAVLVSMDVRDAAKARQFVTALTTAQIGAQSWAKQEINGVEYYMLPKPKLVWLSPLIALTDRFLIAGLDFNSVKTALTRANEDKEKLDANPLYKRAAEAVVKPTAAYAFVDSKAMFERIYGTLRPFLIMWANFMPDASKHVDLNQLPSTESISKHLTPIVYSHATLKDGALVESIGPLTANQALLGTSVVVGLTAFPAIKALLESQTNRPAGAPPSAATPAPTPEPSPSEEIYEPESEVSAE